MVGMYDKKKNIFYTPTRRFYITLHQYTPTYDCLFLFCPMYDKDKINISNQYIYRDLYKDFFFFAKVGQCSARSHLHMSQHHIIIGTYLLLYNRISSNK